MITLRAQEFLIERLRERNPSEVVRQIPRLIDDARALQPESNVILVDLLHTKARAESVRGNRELALDSHEQAVSLANTLLGPNDRTTIAYLANQSVEFGARGEYAKQLETARDAHRRAVARLGKHRPDVVLSLVERSLGDALRNAGHIKDSIATHQRVVADFTLLDGFASNRLRQSQGALALALLEAGDFPTALDTIKATIASGNISGPVSSLLMSDISLLSTMALILQSARRSQPTDNWSATHLLAGSNADALPRLLELELRIVEAQEMTMSGDYSSAKSALGSLTAAIDPEWPHLRADLLRLVAFNARMQGRPMQVDGSKTDTPLQLALASARPLDRIALLGEAAASAFAVGSDAEGIQFGEQCGQLAKRFKYPFSAYLHDCAIAWTRVLVRNQQLDEAATVVRDLVSSWAESNPGSTWHGEALCCLASVEQRRGDASQATNHRRLGIRFMASSIHPGMRGNKSCDAPM
jgi:tetratricopeptide (TPR) repeat protein